MNYQEFKRSYLSELREDMRRIGFDGQDSTKPTFWLTPHADPRLTWVVCFDFSVRGNPFFDVLVGPYWINWRLPSEDPFPRCVGFRNHLCGNGIDKGNTSWNALPGSFKRVVSLLDGPGREYFSHFADPAALLAARPTAQLAFDLGDFTQAAALAESELIGAYSRQHVISSQSPAGQRIQRDSLARSEELLRLSLEQLGSDGELSATRARAALAAAHKTIADITPMFDTHPNSRWLKNLLKACEAVIARGGHET